MELSLYIGLIPKDKKSYTLINDLSHGGWRTGQLPITEEEYEEVCEAIIQHIEKNFQKQKEFLSSLCINLKEPK